MSFGTPCDHDRKQLQLFKKTPNKRAAALPLFTGHLIIHGHIRYPYAYHQAFLFITGLPICSVKG